MIWFLSFHHNPKTQLTSAISPEDSCTRLISWLCFYAPCVQDKQGSWQRDAASAPPCWWRSPPKSCSLRSNKLSPVRYQNPFYWALTFRFMWLRRVKKPRDSKTRESWWHRWFSPGVRRPHAKAKALYLRQKCKLRGGSKGLHKLLEATGLISLSLTSLASFLEARIMHEFFRESRNFCERFTSQDIAVRVHQCMATYSVSCLLSSSSQPSCCPCCFFFFFTFQGEMLMFVPSYALEA